MWNKIVHNTRKNKITSKYWVHWQADRDVLTSNERFKCRSKFFDEKLWRWRYACMGMMGRAFVCVCVSVLSRTAIRPPIRWCRYRLAHQLFRRVFVWSSAAFVCLCVCERDCIFQYHMNVASIYIRFVSFCWIRYACVRASVVVCVCMWFVNHMPTSVWWTVLSTQ